MKIAYVDVFQEIPANSGNDWYSLQLLNDLATIGDVNLYYTQNDRNKRGFVPKDSHFKREYLAPKINWRRVSARLEQLRPEMLFDGSSLKGVKADVVFARVYSFHMAAHIAHENRAPIVLVMHNVEWQYLKHEGYSPLIYLPARLYENYVIDKAAAVTTICPKDYAYASTVTSSEKIYHVPFQPDPALFAVSEAPRYDYGKDRLNVLFYGSLNRRHNSEALAFIKRELIPRLKEHKLLDSIRINIFGSGTPPRSLALKSDPDVNFVGSVESPAPYIRGSDVVIVPVRNPSGVKVRVLEALSCKKPIIAFPEAVAGIESVGGAVIIASTAESFVKALTSLSSLKQESGCVEAAPSIHPFKDVANASDAARYALEARVGRKGGYARRFAATEFLRR